MTDSPELTARERNVAAGGKAELSTLPDSLLPAHYESSPDPHGQREGGRVMAIDKETGDRVFLKWSADVDAIEREAVALETLTHPGIVRLRTKKINAEGGMLVLELIDGVDLETWLRAAGQPPEATVLRRLFTNLADAVIAVHQAGFIHRDLKPANIIIRPDGCPVIVDFGAAARQGDPLETHSLLTDGYAAPEQYRADVAEGPWTDIFGLAAVAFRAIGGRAPPKAPAREQGEAMPSAADSGASGVRKLVAAIDRGLALDPLARPQTAEAWRALLTDAANSSPRSEPVTDMLDDYPPTIKVERRDSEGLSGEKRRAARAGAAAASRLQRKRGGWRWATWVGVAGVAAFAVFWFGRPLYEHHIKDQWIVDGAGGGDTASIADAIGRARAGAVVVIRPGIYRESLEIGRSVRLVAADAAAPPEIIAENAPCLRTSGTGSSISGLVFRALAADAPVAGSEPAPCLVIEGGDLTIETSSITSGAGPAVMIGGSATARIERSEIQAATSTAVVIGGGSRAVILDSRIAGGEGLTVLVHGGAIPRVENNEIDGGDGVLITEGASGVFSGNRINASRNSAFRVAVGADPLVKDNLIEAAGEAGLFVYDGGRGRFESNNIKVSKLSGAIIGDGADVTLTNNRIEGSGEHGVMVLDGGIARLDGNAAVGNSGYGFALAWEADVELGINELSDNKVPDLFDARRPQPASSGVSLPTTESTRKPL